MGKKFSTINSGLDSEREPLRTFRKWTVAYIDPVDLVTEGFCYTGYKDFVKCFKCSNVLAERIKSSSRCSFVENNYCQNCKLGPHNDKTSSKPILVSTFENVKPFLGQIIPEYTNYESRLETYVNAPSQFKQIKEKLIQAGLFYCTKTNQLICCYCCGGMKFIDTRYDIWDQHAYWYPDCFYVLIIKGAEFIQKVSARDVRKQFMEKETYKEKHIEAEISNATNKKDEKFEKSTLNSECNDNSISRLTCKVCYDKEICMIFKYCNHIGCCKDCAKLMRKCPVCNQRIRGFERVFIP